MNAIQERFKEELKEQELHGTLVLHGNEMLKQIVALLLRQVPSLSIGTNGTSVQVMSKEEFGARFLAAFLEEQDPPSGKMLLYTIEEQELITFAQAHGIPVIKEEKNEVRKMLDRIAAAQPQTFSSLGRSAQRLQEAAQKLRKGKEK